MPPIAINRTGDDIAISIFSQAEDSGWQRSIRPARFGIKRTLLHGSLAKLKYFEETWSDM